ncbi:ATP/ADP translocase [Devosia subaequoris]|uniref:ATP/ADP translocase n=1 Tax=Devosia subaequoris TaxID=395930 RepID=A0A7W6NBF8_9HYPH|nr:hypothetical protein [Devosia subaequoris]MBB4051928.1 ATP/ADP translocase [Devosia subaequoris]MCP1210095.1 hypothetical protein [Devosia subaequoris]
MTRFIRAFHRWTSIVFTLTVIANFVAIGFLGQAGVPPLVTFSPLLPLFLLLFSGLFMFVQHYARRRAGLNHA